MTDAITLAQFSQAHGLPVGSWEEALNMLRVRLAYALRDQDDAEDRR